MKRVIKETKTTYSVNTSYVGFALLYVLVVIPGSLSLLVFIFSWLLGGAA